MGLETFNTTCVACHQSTGQGLPGAFPPLVEHAANLYNVEGGRDYLISAVLYGLQGPVEIAGTTYNSVMAPWSSLSDEQVAAVLNYVVTSWGNRELLTEFTPISPDEVAALRGQGLSGAQALELRPSLEAGTDPKSGAEFDTELGLETFNTTCVACH
ncbi:MAG: cytochrome c, partial [Truepera sp.]|nr:cytochrome c [Truepera sp.]